MTPIDESVLKKMELRKLNALRKSIGPNLADEAFVKWLKKKEGRPLPKDDPVVARICEILLGQMDDMRFPRGHGYLIRRGRKRFIVEAVPLKKDG
jgi:hypothetical protein